MLSITCPQISRIWYGSNLSIRIPTQSNTEVTDWLYHMITSKDATIIIQVAAILYQIWYARNILIFEDRYIPECDIIRQAELSIQEYMHANLLPSSHNQHTSSGTHSNFPPQFSSRTQPRRQLAPHRWIKPDPGILKANSDASLREPGVWGLGSIIRNEEGLAIATATWKMDGFEEAAAAEAFAILKTMQLAAKCGFRQVIFETDCESVVLLLKKETRNHRSYIGSMVNEMLNMKTNFDHCLFSFCPRECNRVAHSLAHLALSEPNLVWLEDIPPTIEQLYFSDLLS